MFLFVLFIVNKEANFGIIKILIFALILAFHALMLDYFQIPFHLLLTIFTTCVVFLLLRRPTRNKIGHYIIDLLLATALLSSIQFIITVVAGLFSVDLLEQPITTICIMVVLIVIFARLSDVAKVRTFFEKFYYPNRTTVLFSLISILLMMAVLINLLYYDELLDIAGAGQIYLISIGYFVVNLWLVISLYRMNRANKEKTTVMEYGEHLQDTVDSYRMSVHDFNRHLQTIIVLNYDENGSVRNEKLNTYIESLISDRNRANESAIIMDDVMISALLHQKRNIAKQKDIKFDVNSLGKALAYGIPQNDLMDVLSNLIDNAFEAVEGLDSEDRAVWLDLNEDTVEVRNKVMFDGAKGTTGDTERFFEKGYSTKGAGRGYGLSNVLSIAERHGVRIQHELTDGLVVFRLDFSVG